MLNRFKTIIRAQLTQGVSPHELALTCSLAFVIGTFPLFGTTTALCLLAGIVFRLNQPLLHTLNYVLTPVHLILIPVFVKVGEWMLNAPAVSIRPDEMWAQLHANWHAFLSTYGTALLYGILAWALIAPVLGFLIFFLVKPLVIQISRRRLP